MNDNDCYYNNNNYYCYNNNYYCYKNNYYYYYNSYYYYYYYYLPITSITDLGGIQNLLDLLRELNSSKTVVLAKYLLKQKFNNENMIYVFT